MKNCEKCGKSLQDDAVFCMYCGADLSGEQENKQVNEQENKQINEQVNEQENKQINEQVNEQENKQINEQAQETPQVVSQEVPRTEAEPKQEEVKNTKKKTGLVVGIVLAAFILVMALVFLLPRESKALLPYGLKWGDSYETVLEKDKLAGEFKVGDDGRGTCFRICGKEESTELVPFINAEPQEMILNYEFGEDGLLDKVSYIVLYSPEEGESALMQCVDHYNKVFDQEKVPTANELSGESYFINCKWENEESETALDTTMSDGEIEMLMVIMNQK